YSELPFCELCKKHHRPGQDCRYGQLTTKLPDGFEKRFFLYNYHTALCSEAKAVLLVKAAEEVWRAEEAGYLAVAVLGTWPTPEQLSKLRRLNRPVYLALGSDEAGRKAMSRIQEDVLGNHFDVAGELHLPSPFKDLGEMPLEKAIRFLDANISEANRP